MTLSTQQTLPNRWDVDSVGAVATMGSTGGVDSGDPINLIWQGRHYVYLPASGVNGNGITTAPIPVVATKRVRAFGLWTTATGINGIAAQYESGGGGQRSWAFAIVNDRVLLYASTDGQIPGVSQIPSTTFFGPNGIDVTQPFDLDVTATMTGSGTSFAGTATQGATTHSFSSAVEPSITGTFYSAVPISLVVGNRFTVSSLPGTSPLTGGFSKIIVGSDSDMLVCDPATQIDTRNHRDAGQTGWLNGLGGFWQVRRASPAVAKTAVVTRNVTSLDELTDFIQLPAGDTPTFTPTSGKYTVLVCHRQTVLTTFTRRIFSSESASNNGLAISVEATSPDARAFVGGATTFVSTNKPAGSYPPLETMRVSGAVVNDGVAQTFEYGLGLGATSSITGVGTIGHIAPRNGMIAGTGANQYGGEIFGTIIVPDRALTLAQMNVLAEALLGGAEPVSVFPPTAQIYTPAGLAATTQAIPDRNNFENVGVVGNSTGIDSADPVLIQKRPRGFVWLPGDTTVNNYLATFPTTTAGVHDIDMTFTERRSDWIPPGPTNTVLMNAGTGMVVYMSPTGAVSLFLYNTTTSAYETRQVAVGLGSVIADGDKVSFRITYTAATGAVSLRLSVNDGPFFLQGSNTMTANVSLPAMGWLGFNQSTAGSAIGPVEVYDASLTFDGVLVGSRTTDGVINRNTTGPKSTLITDLSAILPDGTNDMIQLGAAATPVFQAATGTYSLLICGTFHQDSAGFTRMFSSESAINNGIFLSNGIGFPTAGHSVCRVTVGGSGTPFGVNCPGVAHAQGEKFVVGFVVNAGNLFTYRFGAGLSGANSMSAIGTVTHSAPHLCQSAAGIAGAFSSMPLHSAVISHSALTVGQMDAIAAKLLAGEYR